jgi:predicted transcriptional regulator
MFMGVEADLKWIHNELDQVKDPDFIEAIKNMLEYRKKVSTERISIEQYNKEIDEAERDIENGNYYTQEEVEKRAKEWGR